MAQVPKKSQSAGGGDHGGLKMVNKRYGGAVMKKPKLSNVTPKPSVLLHTTWADMVQFLNKAFLPSEVRTPVDPVLYMRLHAGIRNCCTTPIANDFRGLSRYNRDAVVLGTKLYDGLKQFLENHLKKIVATGALLRDSRDIFMFYSKHFDDFDSSSKLLDKLCSPLNKSWVAQGTRMEPVHRMAIRAWRNTLFVLMKSKVVTPILDVIEAARRSETNMVSYVKEIRAVIQSFLYMEQLNGNTSETELPMYQQDFENDFLAATHQFYSERISEIIKPANPQASIVKIAKIIQQEEERVQLLLHLSTMAKVDRVCLQTLVLNNLDLLYSGFRQLVEAKELDGLASFYQVISKISEARVEEMSANFRTILRAFAVNPDSGYKLGENVRSEQFCKELFKFIGVYKMIVDKYFAGSQVFKTALDRACADFINSRTGGFTKIAEHLATYAHIILLNICKNDQNKVTELSDHEMQDKLRDIVRIIHFVQDGDIVEKHLKHHYGNRLLGKLSCSEEMEDFFIQELSGTLDRNYIRKLRQMYTDTVHVSQALINEFRGRYPKQNPEHLGFDFTVYVLAAASWDYPIEPNREIRFQFPEIVRDSIHTFATFYTHKHGNRTLTWIPNKGSGELKFLANLNTPLEKEYTLLVSTYEMAVLLLYSDSHVTSHTMAELQEATKLENEKLTQVVANLTFRKLLVLEGSTIGTCQQASLKCAEGNAKELNDFILEHETELAVKINEPFPDQRRGRKIKLNMQVKSEKRKETEKLENDILRQRQFTIQAIIVRIMKAQKRIFKQNLISEVTKAIQESYYYLPSVPEISAQITNLIDRDYIGRPANPNDVNPELEYIS